MKISFYKLAARATFLLALVFVALQSAVMIYIVLFLGLIAQVGARVTEKQMIKEWHERNPNRHENGSEFSDEEKRVQTAKDMGYHE